MSVLEKAYLLILFVSVPSLYTVYSQSEKELFIVDSIPIYYEPVEGFDNLTESDIESLTIIRDKKNIESRGFKKYDALYYVITKNYFKRPDSIKKIPSTKSMSSEGGLIHLNNSKTPYSGNFITYYLNGIKQDQGVILNGKIFGERTIYNLNGNVKETNTFKNGIANGITRRYYKNGNLKEAGNFKNGQENGVWEEYYSNSEIKSRRNFNYGVFNGESTTYYSSGKIRRKVRYNNGVPEKNKLQDLYREGLVFDKVGDFKSSIKKYSKCIKIDDRMADAYFARGTAKLNSLKFDEAIIDLTKAIEIEPLFTFAYSNRAFVIIRKYEFSGSRTLMQNSEMTVVTTSKNTKISESDILKICEDLNKAISLGDDKKMVLEAYNKYCEKK